MEGMWLLTGVVILVMLLIVITQSFKIRDLKDEVSIQIKRVEFFETLAHTERKKGLEAQKARWSKVLRIEKGTSSNANSTTGNKQ